MFNNRRRSINYVFGGNIMQRGQAALEFIFLILIVVIYLTTVVMPLTKDSKNAITDIDTIAKANNETQKIMNTIQRVSTFGVGTKETLTVFIPINTTIYCHDKNISFVSTLTTKPYPAQCPSGTCSKTFLIPANKTMDCLGVTFTGPNTEQIVIKKSTDNNIQLS